MLHLSTQATDSHSHAKQPSETASLVMCTRVARQGIPRSSRYCTAAWCLGIGPLITDLLLRAAMWCSRIHLYFILVGCWYVGLSIRPMATPPLFPVFLERATKLISPTTGASSNGSASRKSLAFQPLYRCLLKTRPPQRTFRHFAPISQQALPLWRPPCKTVWQRLQARKFFRATA